MLDQAVGKAGAVIVHGGEQFIVPPWTLGALGALRNHVFQRSLRTTYEDGMPEELQAQDRAQLRRDYAIGAKFDPYRLIYDGALDDEENFAVFLWQLLRKHQPSITLEATKQLIQAQRMACVGAVLSQNPQMPPEQQQDQPGAAPSGDTQAPLPPSNGSASSENSAASTS